MRGNIAQLMQQAQKMQEDMQRAQEEVAALEVVGNAGAGMVSVTLGGRMDCRKVRIDPSVLADPEMAEDLIAAAFNDAVNRINAVSQAKMSSATRFSPSSASTRKSLRPPGNLNTASAATSPSGLSRLGAQRQRISTPPKR